MVENLREELSSIKFCYQGKDFSIDTRAAEWGQIRVGVVQDRRGIFGKNIEVAKLTVLPSYFNVDFNKPQIHITGNYNLTYGHFGHIRGLVGFTMQELVEKTGYVIESSSFLFRGGEILFERLLTNHRDSVEVTKTEGFATYYYIFPKNN